MFMYIPHRRTTMEGGGAREDNRGGGQEEEEGKNAVMTREVECGCCGMREECTFEYITWVEKKYGGVWICGLCEVAVKEEQARLGVGVEVAIPIHAAFLAVATADPTVRLASSILQLIKRFAASNKKDP